MIADEGMILKGCVSLGVGMVFSMESRKERSRAEHDQQLAIRDAMIASFETSSPTLRLLPSCRNRIRTRK